MVKYKDLVEVRQLVDDLIRAWDIINRGNRLGWKVKVPNPLTREEIELTIPKEKQENLKSNLLDKLMSFKTKLSKVDWTKIEY